RTPLPVESRGAARGGSGGRSPPPPEQASSAGGRLGRPGGTARDTRLSRRGPTGETRFPPCGGREAQPGTGVWLLGKGVHGGNRRFPPCPDNGPDRPGGLVADRPEPVRHRGVEGDRVVLADDVLLEADADAERAAEHVAELPTTVAHERVLAARRRADRIHAVDEVDVVVGQGGEPLPADALLERDRAPRLVRLHRRV